MKATRQLRSCRSGSAMIEFAMLAPVFFLIVMWITEFVLYQYKSYGLNHVVYEATRNLQTGEVQNSGTAAQQLAAFEANVCAEALPLIDCAQISFDVRTYPSIDQVTFPAVTFDSNGFPQNFVFQPGGAGQYSVVRASMHHQFVTPFMGDFFNHGSGVPAILNGAVIVKNEPWA